MFNSISIQLRCVARRHVAHLQVYSLGTRVQLANCHFSKIQQSYITLWWVSFCLHFKRGFGQSCPRVKLIFRGTTRRYSFSEVILNRGNAKALLCTLRVLNSISLFIIFMYTKQMRI